MDAASGPYPIDELDGEVWATSNDEGNVSIDSLQEFDPHDDSLGPNIYWFYIESERVAPAFIGPITAGESLGDLILGPLLTVEGIIKGTPEQLKNFEAEWDQPEPMLRGNGKLGWLFANSARLKVERVDDTLRFKLSGLSPGKFRIVANSNPGPKTIHHVFSRREPGPDDEVFEWTLIESSRDLVLDIGSE